MFEMPDFIKPYLESEALKRLKKIDMNCGVNYTSLPLFSSIQPYTRYDHSLRVASMIYHFTNDRKQTLAGLFHDISTPAFSHTIDFLNGDHLKQESTESKTKEIILNDPIIHKQLEIDNILIDEVCDYHIYPIADNDSPKLSADRLEYTLSNGVNYGFCSKEQTKTFYDDLVIGKNEENELEIMFQHADIAESFSLLSLKCGRIYSSKEDRYAMEHLSRMLRELIQEQIISYDDLYTDEEAVIQKISLNKKWIHYTQLCEVTEDGNGIVIHAKKRYIDPYVRDCGRISQYSDRISSEINDFLNHDDQNEKLIGVFRDGK